PYSIDEVITVAKSIVNFRQGYKFTEYSTTPYSQSLSRSERILVKTEPTDDRVFGLECAIKDFMVNQEKHHKVDNEEHRSLINKMIDIQQRQMQMVSSNQEVHSNHYHQQQHQTSHSPSNYAREMDGKCFYCLGNHMQENCPGRQKHLLDGLIVLKPDGRG